MATDPALDAAAAQATGKLTPFDGKPVVRTTISITQAGDGLSDALAIDPEEFHHGERVVVVLDCHVGKVVLRPLSKDVENMLVREHVLVAGTSTIIDAQLVEELLTEQAAKIEAAKSDAERAKRRGKGEYTLEDEALVAEHDDGQHANGLRDGCPKCDEEKAAMASEGAPADPPGGVTSLADAMEAKAAAKKSTAKKAAPRKRTAPKS